MGNKEGLNKLMNQDAFNEEAVDFYLGEEPKPIDEKALLDPVAIEREIAAAGLGSVRLKATIDPEILD